MGTVFRVGSGLFVWAVTLGIARADITEAWAQRFPEKGGSAPGIGDLVIDPDGFLYVAGALEESGDRNLVTVKYDLQGNLLWSARYNGPAGRSEPKAAALWPDGGVVVAGTSPDPPTGWCSAIIRYTADGVPSWVYRYKGAQGDATPAALAVTHDRRVVVAGYHSNTGSDPIAFVVQLSSEGELLWEDTIPDSEAHALAVDAEGGMYVAGVTRGQGAPGGGLPQDLMLAKYDPEGGLEWSVRYNANATESAWAIALRRDGSIVVSGESSPIGYKAEFLVMAYSPRGRLLWKTIYSGSSDDAGRARYMVMDSSENIVVAGSFGSDPPGPDILTMKLSPEGKILWLDRYDGPVNGEDRAKALAIDGGGNIYVAGTVTVDAASLRREMVVMCYDPDGRQKWCVRPAADDPATTQAEAIAVDPGGNVYAAGIVTGATERYFLTIRYSQPFTRGDIDGSGQVDISDAVSFLEWAFLGTSSPPCLEAADVNNDGLLNIVDPVFLLRWLFQGGPDIPPPRACGFDAHVDLFSCESFPPCS